ncbi:MAG: protease inhibitor I42 family protein [Clostridia bacterium]|nr:protease inhibitor I42 family protein [Clostridia bacterium]
MNKTIIRHGKAANLIITLLSALLCLMLCLTAAAEPAADVFEISGGVLTVRFPEGTEPVFSFLSGDYTMEPLTDGETVNGITSVSYILPEEAGAESQLFAVAVDLSSGEQAEVRMGLYCTLENGDLYCMGITKQTPDFYVDCSEGYEYSDGRTLMIRLPGSPATGYEWTLTPDNSGVLELVDSYEIDMRANEEDPLVTGMGFFFLPAANPAGTEGTMLFTLTAAPEGVPTGTELTFAFSLDEDGQIAGADCIR